MKLSECWNGRVVTPVNLDQDYLAPGESYQAGPNGEKPFVGHIDGFKFDGNTGVTRVLVNWGRAQKYLSAFKPEDLKPYED